MELAQQYNTIVLNELLEQVFEEFLQNWIFELKY